MPARNPCCLCLLFLTLLAACFAFTPAPPCYSPCVSLYTDPRRRQVSAHYMVCSAQRFGPSLCRSASSRRRGTRPWRGAYTPLLRAPGSAGPGRLFDRRHGPQGSGLGSSTGDPGPSVAPGPASTSLARRTWLSFDRQFDPCRPSPLLGVGILDARSVPSFS